MTTIEKLIDETERDYWKEIYCFLSALPGHIYISDGGERSRNVPITDIEAASSSAESCDAWAAKCERLAKQFRARAEWHRNP